MRRLIGSASAWGGNPETNALHLNVVPPKNDGRIVYAMAVKDVPVDGKAVNCLPVVPGWNSWCAFTGLVPRY